MMPILQLLACVALVGAAVYWEINAPEGNSMYRSMLPYVLIAGLLGVAILYGYLMEFFVASYSGAIYEVEGFTGATILWVAISIILTALPLAGLIPLIGRHTVALIAIGVLASIPSTVHLVSALNNQKEAEQAGAYNP
jgi:hypothetical protein